MPTEACCVQDVKWENMGYPVVEAYPDGILTASEKHMSGYLCLVVAMFWRAPQ